MSHESVLSSFGDTSLLGKKIVPEVFPAGTDSRFLRDLKVCGIAQTTKWQELLNMLTISMKTKFYIQH